jgi:hypothetical protein
LEFSKGKDTVAKSNILGLIRMTLINPESVYLRFTLSASPLGVNSGYFLNFLKITFASKRVTAKAMTI